MSHIAAFKKHLRNLKYQCVCKCTLISRLVHPHFLIASFCCILGPSTCNMSKGGKERHKKEFRRQEFNRIILLFLKKCQINIVRHTCIFCTLPCCSSLPRIIYSWYIPALCHTPFMLSGNNTPVHRCIQLLQQESCFLNPLFTQCILEFRQSLRWPA